MAELGDVETAGDPVGVGAQLRAARAAAGLTLGDVAARTRVSERHLAAIEDGRFADLASRTYAVGFARAYARHVGLDEHEIATEVRAEMDRSGTLERPRPVTFDPGDPARVPGRGLAWLAALVGVGVIVGVFFWWRSYYDPAAPLDRGSIPANTVANAPGAPRPGAAPASAAPAAAPAGPVVFTATESAIWVKFYDASGKQLLQKQLAKGESYTVPADAAGPKLWTGRADALEVTIGGKPVAPIATGPGKVKDVPVDAASLLKRPAAAGAAGVVPTAAASGVAAAQ